MNEARILVIEDETPIRRFLKIAVESAGFALVEADRGRLGVEKAATEAPDLVVLDLGLPDMDGKDVIVAIREWSQVPMNPPESAYVLQSSKFLRKPDS